MTLNSREEEDDEIAIIEKESKKRSINVGLVDQFAKSIKVDDASMSARKKMRQQNINDAIAKKRLLEVHQYLARWVYEVGFPFHAIEHDSFKRFVEALGQYGPSYIPPSQYQLREPLLKGEEVSNDAHTAQYIFDYINACIIEVGPQNVIQTVSDNASNNMAATKLLALERPNIFWISCATHTINLMLEGISKLPMFNGVIKKANSFTIFIYAQHKTLALMRKFTKSEIVRPGVTRFASSFLTLQSLLDKKQELRNMMTSNEWDNTKWSRSKKGKKAFDIVVPNDFWNSMDLCLRIFTPLVKVLTLVDGEEKPSMDFVYGEILNAKEEIRKIFKEENDYLTILNIIDSQSKDRLDAWSASYHSLSFEFILLLQESKYKR
ncbi:uncharacterized protein LOC121972865 [Zingiber officinale]|uniref:uncharacterized protein LOC121972865 n=1 Tax=Zingiber officinale TaxID=94328 RepID=UPI001C4DC3F8|nr:uncharacterized protein LOC121972865 [Zingiber officinale]